ncbi:PP2C family protein-serine/threonine phosphatase [Nocardia brasiliensis]|uniref:Serine/threonine protein phosphatase n=1 Tax=Nocardia brasiliensis (strain ATCC 700358 / HUJEG-1) TaxID=1133849 RepID=K0F3J0_NOCB7|nr:serine/threonine protein phosphatase [Nocardia brasiliensis]AFU02181.1 serine/threonine protein phosphatase [Nocardia brasiliensis ATCC 700358]OCF87620.1 serine/threonine protein phosphatase [Nocardia brasiliensis]
MCSAPVSDDTDPEEVRLTGATWESVSRRGARSLNADAAATHTDPGTGRTAFVVADGIGNHLLAVRAARMVAAVAARVATADGARAGILAAQAELLRQFPQSEADSVLVVAVLPAGDGPADIAWVGDCRAYRWNGRVLHQITVDHTVAEFWRIRGQQPPPRLNHLVTTSARTVRAADIGQAGTGSSSGRLLLSTDGVHKRLDIATIKAVLANSASATLAADTLVQSALHAGGTDNATALVADRRPR